MPAKIAGFILRSHNRRETAEFYTALGLTSNEHSHGGPVHAEVGPNSPTIVLEVYSRSEAYHADAVMIEVDSIENSIRAVARFDPDPVYPIRGDSGFRFIYISDPDERPVMLIEKK